MVTYHLHAEALDHAKDCAECGRPVVVIGNDTARPRKLDVDARVRARAGGFELPVHTSSYCKPRGETT